jgi:integral membrane protein
MNFNSLLGIFRWVAVLEGISYLILVGVGMPLKYIFKNMEFILFAGWAHGVLFMAFCLLLLLTGIRYKWKFTKMVVAFVASLLPLGTFWFEYRLRKENERAEQ